LRLANKGHQERNAYEDDDTYHHQIYRKDCCPALLKEALHSLDQERQQMGRYGTQRKQQNRLGESTEY
jgi:hypothetical protein